MTDDFSELLELAADLTGAPEKASRYVKKAVEVTARHIKDDWAQGAERTGLGPYAADVTYDMKYPGGSIDAEIGPTPGDQGSLGIVEDAPGNVKSAPQHAARDAMEANEPDFVRGLEIAIFDATAEVVKG